jgi:hypothetical protein
MRFKIFLAGAKSDRGGTRRTAQARVGNAIDRWLNSDGL